MRTTHAHHRAAKPSLLSRLTGRTRRRTVTTTTTVPRTTRRHNHHHHTTTAAPVHHHQRRPSIGDKISGALMRIRGSLTHRPGVKVWFTPLFCMIWRLRVGANWSSYRRLLGRDVCMVLMDEGAIAFTRWGRIDRWFGRDLIVYFFIVPCVLLYYYFICWVSSAFSGFNARIMN